MIGDGSEARDGSSIEDLIVRWKEGDGAARDRLFELIAPEIALIASALLRREQRVISLQTGDVVNEVIVKLIVYNREKIAGMSHLKRLIATILRNFFVDYVRRKTREKRNGLHISLTASHEEMHKKALDLLALETALIRLAAIERQLAHVVEMRIFGNMTVDETAEALGVAPATVDRMWSAARQWLAEALANDL